MGRNEDGEIPFNRNRDDGTKGYRVDTEPNDGRPLLSWRQFWDSDAEEQSYERAIREIKPWKRWVGMKPRPQPNETEEQLKARERFEEGAAYMGLAALCSEITQLAEGLYPKPLGTMKQRMSQREWERRQWAAKQAGGLRMTVDEEG